MMSLENIDSKEVDQSIIDEFIEIMNQDFNIPNVMTLVYDVLKQMNKEKRLKSYRSALSYDQNNIRCTRNHATLYIRR